MEQSTPSSSGAVQCLFHSKPIRERLLSEQDGEIMKDLINSYMQRSQNLNTFIIRHLAGQEYVFTKKIRCLRIFDCP